MAWLPLAMVRSRVDVQGPEEEVENLPLVEEEDKETVVSDSAVVTLPY